MFHFSTQHFRNICCPLKYSASFSQRARHLRRNACTSSYKMWVTNQNCEVCKVLQNPGIPQLLHAAWERGMVMLMEHLNNFSFPICQKSGKGIILCSNMQAYKMQYLMSEGSRTHTFYPVIYPFLSISNDEKRKLKGNWWCTKQYGNGCLRC
jgi:hypothetical protein